MIAPLPRRSRVRVGKSDNPNPFRNLPRLVNWKRHCYPKPLHVATTEPISALICSRPLFFAAAATLSVKSISRSENSVLKFSVLFVFWL